MERIDIEGLRSGIKDSWDWENCAVCNQPLSTECTRLNEGDHGVVKKVCCGITYYSCFTDYENGITEYEDWRFER